MTREQPIDELDRKIACAINDARYEGGREPYPAHLRKSFDESYRSDQEYSLRLARAARPAIYAALREVTPEMIEATLDAGPIPAEDSAEYLALNEREKDRAWWRGQLRAAIDASPLAPKKEG